MGWRSKQSAWNHVLGNEACFAMSEGTTQNISEFQEEIEI